jgi:hypothetical protein
VLICSCAVISDRDIELALLEIMNQPNAPLPTPGVVWRHLSKKMNCCGCAPLAVSTIYEKMESLEARGLIQPCACAAALERLVRLDTEKSKALRRNGSRETPARETPSPIPEDLPLAAE